MTNFGADYTKMISDKFYEFQKAGLVQYSKYLNDQLDLAEKKGALETYKNYLKTQIIDAKKKIEAIDEKMKL